jgi:hypothetical protein
MDELKHFDIEQAVCPFCTGEFQFDYEDYIRGDMVDGQYMLCQCDDCSAEWTQDFEIDDEPPID